MIDLNRKLVALMLATVSMLLIAPLAKAQLQTMTIWTDKAEYAPGENGTLYFVFYNEEASALTIKKITIVFDEWSAYRNDQWEGNLTIELVPPQGVASKGIYANSTKFTVPNDGRAPTTMVHVTIQTEEISSIGPWHHTISVVQTPRYMEQIVTLFTLQIVLIIVCTVILAAAIFLSARRPQVTWSKEQT